MQLSYGKCIVAIALMTLIAASVVAAQTSPQEELLQELGCEKALIVNGDDLGRTKWSNEGILKAFREGILQSTSFMIPALAADEAFEMLRENPDLDVGVHLVLARDDGKDNLYGPLTPVEKVKHLVDADGNFITSVPTIISSVPKKEMGIELSAQLKKAYDGGVDVTHFDCHGGFYHLYDKKSVGVVMKLAAKYDLPIRWTGRPTDAALVRRGIIVPNFTTMVNMKDPYEKKKEKMLKTIANLKPGITEIVCHPATGGYTPEEAEWRNGDLRLTLDPDVRKAIDDNGVCLMGYREMRDFQRKRNEKKKEGKAN